MTRDMHHLSDEQRKKALWLVENGYGLAAVCERYGLSKNQANLVIVQERRKKKKGA